MCQRMFTQGPGSHYIRVQYPSTDDPQDPSRTPLHPIQPAGWSSRSRRCSPSNGASPPRSRRASSTRRIHGSGGPSGRRTQGIYPNDLLACVATPDGESENSTEQGARAIWEAIQDVGRISQRVTAQIGHFHRIEAHRTERQSVRHYPLQAYMDEECIVRHIQPW